MNIDELLIDFDEMGFAPTALCKYPEECAREWKSQLVDEIDKLKEERAALTKALDGQWTFKTVTASGNTAGKLNALEIIRRAAREEFADKLKEMCIRKRVPIDLDDEDEYYFDGAVTIDEIDRLLEEYKK